MRAHKLHTSWACLSYPSTTSSSSGLLTLALGSGPPTNPAPHSFNAHSIQVAIESSAASDVDYLLIVNGESRLLGELQALATRRPNVRVLPRPNECYDGGSMGEVLRTHPELLAAYKYYLLLNSSVRGPFLPRYFDPRGQRPWTAALTGLLSDDVKLVGTTISCQGQVHVQSMVLATDRVGLAVLWKAGTLDCARDRDDAILRYELGASAQIMARGYSVDCLMLRYRGVDWLREQQAHAACNGGRNPFVALNNDGLDINPLEVLFVKVKPHSLASDHALQRWTDYRLGRDADLQQTHFDSPAVQRLLGGRRQRLERLVADCRAAFDHAAFARMYPALARPSPQATYADFLEKHLWGGHAFRYTLRERRESQLPFPECRPFLHYGAPDLSS